MKAADEELMRFLDGELSPGESRSVEERLTKAPHLQRQASAVAEVGAVIRARYEQAAEDAEPELLAMWARIEKNMAAPGANQKRSAFAWLASWMSTYRSYVATSLVSAAAGVLVATTLGTSTKVLEVVKIVEVERPAQAGLALAKSADAEVESLEVTGGTGIIFQIPAEKHGEAATAVIWVTPETPPAGTEDPI